MARARRPEPFPPGGLFVRHAIEEMMVRLSGPSVCC